MANIYEIICANTNDGDSWALSIPNVKGEGSERHFCSTNPDKLQSWSKKRDAPGSGQYFCVSTIQHKRRRKKEFARQMLFIFADVDAKDIALDKVEIKRRLLALPKMPTRIHDSGNGYHVFFQLQTPVDLTRGMDRAEILLKRLANHIGGDIQVAHCVALLRVPGTHNSKRGEWKRVTVLHEGTQTYTIQELERWLDSEHRPVMVRKDRQMNPFLRVAEEQSFKAPVDVEARLRDMVFEGEGENGVHATHLSCTASLVCADWEEDDIVNLILPATQALEGTGSWNWVQEERALRNMIRDFERKVQKQRRSRGTLSAAAVPPDDDDDDDDDDGVSVSLNDAQDSNVIRLKRGAKGGTAKASTRPAEHITLGMGILEALKEQGQLLMYTEKLAWLYEAGIWTALDEAEEKKEINEWAERGCRELGLVSNTKIVNETRAWLQRNPDLSKKKIKWDNHGDGCIAMRNGILDLEDGTILPLTPEDYATRLIDAEYDPTATCPIWERMLAEDYRFDTETIQFLQEFTGTCLITEKPRGLMRALVLLGPSNTGKSNILNVIAGLISNVYNSTPLAMMENHHGLMPFLKSHPWVLHEAFEQSRWEMSANVKALLSGDSVQVNIKNGAIVPLVFKQPILWGSNVPPQFKEASRAMEMRLAIVKMHRAYDPLQVVGTAQMAIEAGLNKPSELVLRDEKPGLLNWAIAGLRRALARKHFVFTTEMSSSLLAMRTDSNMALGFINECAEYDPDTYVRSADFYGAFTAWWRDYRDSRSVPSVDSLGRAMSSLSDPLILTGQQVGKQRIYAGLRLNENGLDCWRGYSGSQRAEESGLRISETESAVNRRIGPQQLERAEFQAMQEAHRLRALEPDA